MDPVLPFLALGLAWLIPGAGHVLIGRIRRGIIIFVVICATFWAGVAIGGPMTVDKRTERWWYVAEMLAGVNGLIGKHIETKIYSRIDQQLMADQTFLRQYRYLVEGGDIESQRLLQQLYTDDILTKEGIVLAGPADTAARAYSGVAGLLNLMCVFDAVLLAAIGVRGEPPARKDSPAQAQK